MAASILVSFATRSGSTQEVAEAIAGTLREDGLAVACQPLSQVKTLEGYSSGRLGCAALHVPLAQGRQAFPVAPP